MRATRGDGTVVFYAPVSSGSVHDPLPIGDWKVTGVELASGVSLQPGSVLGRESDEREGDDQTGAEQSGRRRLDRAEPRTLRLHGTPEPANIGHTESHGCVRLTNWDATHLASIVKPGTPVLFR